MPRIKIFLGDLVHTYGQAKYWSMPLNIGYIAAYTNKHFGNDVDIRLFKYPESIIESIKTEKPDILGLSCYIWNDNLNQRIFEIAKIYRPNVLTIGGGPGFTPINTKEKDAYQYFQSHPYCNVYILDQGERSFVELLQKLKYHSGNIVKLLDEPVPGALINRVADGERVIMGTPMKPFEDLDEIPSPYLTGLLDPFFEGPFVPIIETNRTCPYACTYCTWGAKPHSKSRFSLERVLSEIEYISNRKKKVSNMFIADNNFGLLERDEVIAIKIRDTYAGKGYPAYVSLNWGKAYPHRVQKVAGILKGIASIGASMQSLNDRVLKAIKRKNLALEELVKIQINIQAQGVDQNLYSELILGLPMETKQSHIDANKKLINLGAEIYNYNLYALPGSELDTEDYRRKFIKQTRWRLFDGSYGTYERKRVFEGQEVIAETTTMTINEIRSFRFVHFLMQFMWNKKFYYEFLIWLKQNSVHPMDFILQLSERFQKDKGDLSNLYDEFDGDFRLEDFKSFEDMVSYWNKDENYDRLQKGTYGKLNYVYTFKILLDYKVAFNQFLYKITSDILKSLNLSNLAELLKQCKEILRFESMKVVEIDENLKILESKKDIFSYDIKNLNGKSPMNNFNLNLRVKRNEYEFYLTKEHMDLIEKQLNLFYAGNLNSTLRQISMYNQPDLLLYGVR